MYASIRRYRFSPDDIRDIIATGKAELIPRLKELPGFISHFGILQESGVLTIVNFYETEAEAARANEIALAWVKERLPAPIGGLPDVAHGEVILEELPE